MKRSLRRVLAAMAGVGVLIAPVAGTAVAAVVPPAVPRAGSLVQVGPIADNGFPAWYRDSNNVRLEACTTVDDPLCPVLAADVPNPEVPVSFPDNFPEEFFYELNDATLTLTGGVKAVVSMNLEGAFANGGVVPGDQMVFGRIRIRFAAPAGERYRITHPYGIDDIVADGKGVNFTEDAGAAAGAFGLALNGRVGPFLKWDPAVAPAAPAGYAGDPGVTHAVVGSPYNTNFVRIEKLDPATGAVLSQVGFTDQFSVQGRYATNAGVDVDAATYGGNAIEVYATSEPGQVIEVAGNPALGFRTTRLRGSGGHYYGRVPLTGPVPPGTRIEVVNASDRPQTRKSQPLTDIVTVNSARYDADAQALSVSATSSDSSQTLTVTGFGPLTGSPFANVAAPPPRITVTSSGGGSATVALTGSGKVFLPGPPVAAAIADTPAIVGQIVKLDGSGSAGEVDSYAWKQTDGPAVTLSGGDSAVATFVPAAPGSYTFQLGLAGPGGNAIPATVTVTVVQAQLPKADAGADQTVVRGKAVSLDGSRSSGVETYSWKQISGPAVTLTGATTARPSFTFPALTLPAAPGPNPAYVFTNDPVVLELTVRNPAGIATARTTVRPQADGFTGLTARYRTGNQEWRISGTTTLIAGQRVIAVLGAQPTGAVIGTPTAADAAGAFAIRVNAPPAPGTATVVTLITTTGGRASVAIQVTN